MKTIIRKTIILVVFILVSATTFSQKSFRLEWDEDGITRPHRGIVDAEENTVIVGFISKPESNYDRDAFLFKMDTSGNYSYDRISEVSDTSISYNSLIQLANGNYFVIGRRGTTDYNAPNRQDDLVIAIYDINLNLISFNSFEIKELYKYINGFSIILENDSEVFAAATAEKKNSSPPIQDLALIRFNSEGDTIEARYHRFEKNVTVYDIDKIPNSENYLVLTSPALQYGAFDCMIVSPELELVSANYFSQEGLFPQDHLTCDYWYPNKQFLAASTLSLTEKLDKGLAVYRLDTLANLFDYLFLNKPNVYDHNAFRGCMAFADESSIYIAGYEADGFNCENPDSIELYVVDTGLNQLAYKALGGEYSYDAYGVLTSKKGDAIIFGRTYYPEIDCGGNLVVYYISRDELGVPPVKVFNMENPSAKSLVYPNPAKQTVNIQIKGQKTLAASRIRLYNIKGKKIYDCQLPNQGNTLQLNVKNLASGIYFYEVVSNEKTITKGKFIKE